MKRKSSAKKIILIILLTICSAIIILLATFFFYGLYIKLSTPDSYIITAENRFDYQPHLECSGYSSAYVLRSMGIDADGMTIYNDLQYKNADGTVMPDMLVKSLNEQGYNVQLCSGTVLQIKHEVSKGVPVIVFVRTAPQINNYHYLPITGYDEENFYAAESLADKVNADEQYYNRVISASDLETMLDTGIYKINTYITFK